jgi:alkylation response protein AidB-like acyl-CoA dehydrogenase
MSAGLPMRAFEEVCAWAKETGVPDPIIARPWVQLDLARAHAKLEVLKLLNWRQAASVAGGTLSPAEASTAKVFGSELYVEVYKLLLGVLGPAGGLKLGSPGAVLRGRLERLYRATLVLTFGGGTNEVQRDIIAMAGMGIPRMPY